MGDGFRNEEFLKVMETVGPPSRISTPSGQPSHAMADHDGGFMDPNSPSPAIQPAPTAATPDRLSWPGHMADDGGSTFGMEPCATLTATPDLVEISGTRGHYRIPRAHVTKIGRGRLYPWFFGAVRIYHSLPGISRELQFKPLGGSPADVRLKLKSLGFPVA